MENTRDLPAEEGSLVWMRYMRFVRRTETIPASRKMFMRARKWPRCSWQVRDRPVWGAGIRAQGSGAMGGGMAGRTFHQRRIRGSPCRTQGCCRAVCHTGSRL